MTREDMFHKLTLRYEELVCKYADKNVPDKQFFEELCCSIYSGDERQELKPEESIKLDNDYCFKYRGYEFELTPCTMLINKAQVLETADAFKHDRVRGIFTDRYVCWMFGHKDSDGKTLKEYLEDNPDETEQSHTWSREIYLVPGAWSWGAEFDCDPGCEVDKLILDKIDEFLKQNPDL